MPLPDTNNWSSRIYELLKETDLENLSYAQFQAVAEKLFIEPENEDEMRRLVLVQLARMAVRGDWDGFISGGSQVPANADYLLAFDQGTVPSELTNARKLVVGNNISMAHGAGDNDDMTISATPGGSDGQIQYNVAGVLAATGLLSTNKTNTFTLVATSGDGQIDISSSTKAVSLLCDENQKLKVKGSTDSFVLDVSSATGGITFPDGTTQTTAATAGSPAFANILPQLSSTSETLYNLGTSPPWGLGGNDANVSMATMSQPFAFPFIAPETGSVSAIGLQVNTAVATQSAYVAIYSNGSDNLPNSRLGYATISLASTGEIFQTSITGTISLTRGEQYWYSINSDSAGSAQLNGTEASSGLPGLGLAGNMTAFNTAIKDNSVSSYAVPPTSFTSSFGYPTWNRVHVGLKF